ncbi:MAG: TIGR04282 family arsenosugar biosynthesis glycosyltransferase [Kribbellaceae bacterium]
MTSGPEAAAVLVMAKAPVPGYAKTRLAATVGPRAAADLAMDSLLDTLAAAAGTGWPVVVALTGDIDSAARADELRAALARCLVIEQRGRDLGERLAAAHADAMAVGGATGVGGTAVVQIGSDTPQVQTGDLVAARDRLIGRDAVLGPAVDGGWWLLATWRPAVADCLASVPMSRADTGARTLRALGAAGRRVCRTKRLRDVDTGRDAEAVARLAPGSRFAMRWSGGRRARTAGRSEAALVAPGIGP